MVFLIVGIESVIQFYHWFNFENIGSHLLRGRVEFNLFSMKKMKRNLPQNIAAFSVINILDTSCLCSRVQMYYLKFDLRFLKYYSHQIQINRICLVRSKK